MPRINRAAQFAPFDALKDLHDALKLEECKHEEKLKDPINKKNSNKNE